MSQLPAVLLNALPCKHDVRTADKTIRATNTTGFPRVTQFVPGVSSYYLKGLFEKLRNLLTQFGKEVNIRQGTFTNASCRHRKSRGCNGQSSGNLALSIVGVTIYLVLVLVAKSSGVRNTNLTCRHKPDD